MIVDIQKGGFIKGLIDYHEKKITEGKGQLLHDNTTSKNKEERIRTFIETAELNEKIDKNKYVHFSVSFAKEDRIEPEEMVKIGLEYLKEMSYLDVPVLMYEHVDKRHRHFHIVTTSMDLQGKKIIEFKDFQRSQELSRKLEKSFGLTPTVYENKRENNLQELNSGKYKFFNAIPALELNIAALAELSKVVDGAMIQRIKDQKSSDYNLEQELLMRGNTKDDYHLIFRILAKHNLVKKTGKQKITERLKYIHSISRDRDDFINRVERDGIYVRKIASSNSSYSLTYGLKEDKFYVKEKDLPVEFRYDFLFTGKQVSKSFDENAQRKYLKRIVQKVASASNTKNEFDRQLSENNIEAIYVSNSKGIYGVSFKSNNIKDAKEFKGSQLDKENLTWTKLAAKFGYASVKVEKEPAIKKGPQQKPSLKNILSPLSERKDSPQQQEEERKRRRERGEDQEQEIDQ